MLLGLDLIASALRRSSSGGPSVPPPSEDPDAAAYLAAVEAADGEALEAAVRDAVNALVVGLKADGLWSAILTCCLLIGPRTLAGALVPLRGPAPASFSINDTMYLRRTGLKGNVSASYIDTGVAASAAPSNNGHLATSVSEVSTQTGLITYAGSARASGGSLVLGRNSSPSPHTVRNQQSTSVVVGSTPALPGFLGTSRFNSAELVARCEGVSTTTAQSSTAQATSNIMIFTTNASDRWAAVRLRWWTFGAAVDLAALDARFAAYQAAIEAALP